MALDLSSFSGLSQNLGNLMPSGNAIVENVLLGVASGVVMKGITAQMQGGAIPDPLHLSGSPAAVNNNPAVTSGPTITASAYAALPPAVQAQLMGVGVHIVAG